jgi:DNA repair protein RadC
MDKEHWQGRGKGHRERLRQRFLEGGLERFSDEEVVEFLLTLGTPRGDLKLPAREAVKQFGSLSKVLSAQECPLPKAGSSGREEISQGQGKYKNLFQLITVCL